MNLWEEHLERRIYQDCKLFFNSSGMVYDRFEIATSKLTTSSAMLVAQEPEMVLLSQFMMGSPHVRIG